MQTIYHLVDGRLFSRELPDPEVEVMPGVLWGPTAGLFTPAYWVSQLWFRECESAEPEYRFGSSLAEEVAICLLGGHGISAELSMGAFYRLRDEGLLSDPQVTEIQIYKALREPLLVKNHHIRYRFPHQKAIYLAPLLRAVHTNPPLTLQPTDFRDWLMGFKGVGFKTASWIVRNWLDADEVAILDIHILRAGRIMGLYSKEDRVERNYKAMEERFVFLAEELHVRTSVLDVFIWLKMRDWPNLVLSALNLETFEAYI